MILQSANSAAAADSFSNIKSKVTITSAHLLHITASAPKTSIIMLMISKGDCTTPTSRAVGAPTIPSQSLLASSPQQQGQSVRNAHHAWFHNASDARGTKALCPSAKPWGPLCSLTKVHCCWHQCEKASQQPCEDVATVAVVFSYLPLCTAVAAHRVAVKERPVAQWLQFWLHFLLASWRPRQHFFGPK